MEGFVKLHNKGLGGGETDRKQHSEKNLVS